MNRMRLLPIVKGTTPLLKVILRDDLFPRPQGFTPLPLDLTSGTVTLKARLGPDAGEADVFSRNLTNDSEPTTGKASYRLTTADTATAGLLYCRMTVTWTAGARSGQVLPAGDFQIQVKEF